MVRSPPPSAKPASAVVAPAQRLRQLALHLHQLSSAASLLKVLQLCASTLASLVIHGVGPRGRASLKALRAPLEHVEVEFDPDWVLSILAASPSPPSISVSDSPTGFPTPTASPAACGPGLRLGGDVPALPDLIALLADSMSTLRALRTSNALALTVADNLRYPRVKALAFRLASPPAVTPLMHAFLALAELYVYTSFDGCWAPSLFPSLGFGIP